MQSGPFFCFHFAVKARDEGCFAGVFSNLDFVELEAPLPGAVMVLEAVNLENRRPLFLVAFGMKPSLETAPKV